MLKIKHFYDSGLAQASYAIVSAGKAALIDPARDPRPYLDWAREQQAQIVAIVETHPHADFASGHLELHQKTGANLYCSAKTGATYPHRPVKNGDQIPLGNIHLKVLETPGHSPDSISLLLVDENQRDYAVFTGDTLFVGDVGRPDLREQEHDASSKREQLAKQLYSSIRDVLMKLPRETMLYPGHGAGSLCGNSIGEELSSTLGRELEQNWALQQMPEEQFVNRLLEQELPIPRYFQHCVALNKQGAPELEANLAKIPRLGPEARLQEQVLVVDVRDQLKFKNRHIRGALNLMDGAKFETWLGSLVNPGEPFYLLGDQESVLEELLRRAGSIGYEQQILGVQVHEAPGQVHDAFLILEHFKAAPHNYTVVDVRNPQEVSKGKFFAHALPIPLHQLRERFGEIPQDKPIAVHCAGGYRSAAAFSILETALPNARVYDIGEAIKDYQFLH